MAQVKINRDWRNMEKVPDCTRNYGNGDNPNLQRDSNNADATGSRLMYLIKSNTAYWEWTESHPLGHLQSNEYSRFHCTYIIWNAKLHDWMNVTIAHLLNYTSEWMKLTGD